MEKFKVYRIHEIEKKTVARFEDVGIDELDPGEVVIRVSVAEETDGGGVSGVRVFAGGSVSAVGNVHAGVDCDGAGAEQLVFGAHLHSCVSSGAPVL